MRWDLFQPPVKLLAPWPDRMLSTEEERAEGRRKQRAHEDRVRNPPRKLTDEEINEMVKEARARIKEALRLRGIEDEAA